MQEWHPVARQVSVAKRLTLAPNARLLALLDLAMADARVGEYVCWTALRPLNGKAAECRP